MKKELQIIHLALLTGITFIATIFIFLKQEDAVFDTEINLFSILAMIVSLSTCIIAHFFINQNKITQTTDDSSYNSKSVYIIKWAIMEAGCIICLVLFFIKGNWMELILAAFPYFGILYNRPTDVRIDKEERY